MYFGPPSSLLLPNIYSRSNHYPLPIRKWCQSSGVQSERQPPFRGLLSYFPKTQGQLDRKRLLEREADNSVDRPNKRRKVTKEVTPMDVASDIDSAVSQDDELLIGKPQPPLLPLALSPPFSSPFLLSILVCTMLQILFLLLTRLIFVLGMTAMNINYKECKHIMQSMSPSSLLFLFPSSTFIPKLTPIRQE